jgi:hypothetical protein
MFTYDKLTCDKICDKSSTLYNVSFMSGSAIAPLIGGLLDDKVGFRYTTDIMTVSSCILTLCYIIVIATILVVSKEEKSESPYDDEKEYSKDLQAVLSAITRDSASPPLKPKEEEEEGLLDFEDED